MLRSFAKRHMFSDETKNKLDSLAAEHQRIADDKDGFPIETMQSGRQASQNERPGIYVYSLPHYLEHPVKSAKDDNQSNDRTFLKVGMSNVDAQGRIKQQETTALPEPIQILRHYTSVKKGKSFNYQDVEARMHAHLNAADHNQNRNRGAGKEWFLTHLTFIDSTANLLGLVIEYADDAYPTEVVFDLGQNSRDGGAAQGSND